jgi:hypothetical protein
MAYNKTIQKRGKANQQRDLSEWIVAVGKHKGIISGTDWILVQKFLDQNKSKSYHKPKSNTALLSGLIFCGNCGSYMRPKLSQRKNGHNEMIYSYLCELKERSRCHNCNMKNPNGNILDKAICEEIKKLSAENSQFIQQLESSQIELLGNRQEYDEQLEHLRKSYQENDKEISALVSSISKATGTPAESYIIRQIDELHEKSIGIKNRIEELESITKKHVLSDIQFDILRELLTTFKNTFEDMNIEQKRLALRTFVKKILWDGDNVQIFMFGADSKEIDLTTYDNSFEPNGEHSKRNTYVLP